MGPAEELCSNYLEVLINKCFWPDKIAEMYLNISFRFIKRKVWKKIQNKLKAEPISAVYNYSAITLTEGMIKLLNRGLNFCVTPVKLNITQLLTEIGKFERKVVVVVVVFISLYP